MKLSFVKYLKEKSNKQKKLHIAKLIMAKKPQIS